MGTTRTRSLILGTILITTALAIPQAADATEVAADFVVGASGEALAAAGYKVIDDYGAFATASLTPSETGALLAQGIEVAPLDHTLGRAGLDGSDVASGLEASPTSPLFVVQFRGPVKAEWQAMLAERARNVYDYLPDDSYLVRLAPDAVDALAALPMVRAVEPYHPAWKISPEIPAVGSTRVTALAFLDEPLPIVLAKILATGALPVDSTTAAREHVIDAMATLDQVRAIARLDEVSWIEPAYDEASTDNAQSSAITQGGATGAWPLHAKGVDGSSQMASVCDTGTNTDAVASVPAVPAAGVPAMGIIKMTHEMHDDPNAPLLVYNAHMSAASLPFEHRKMALYYSPRENNQTRGDSDDTDGHGTHTSGTIAGNAPDAAAAPNPYSTRNGNDGVAYAAKLLVCDITIGSSFQILNNYENYWDPAYAMGARVNSNSWGSTHTATYTEKARQHDIYVWDQRDMVILRSIGNIPNAMRPESVAKSALAIGATGNGAGLENIASFSGNGLTQDGRMKPNVVAPGECLVSSYLSAPNSYSCISGTSMSTPTVAGAATLIRDYFAEGYYPSGSANSGDAINPSSALVRAILQISGREIANDRATTGFPNKIQGWGRVTLDDALYFAGDAKGLKVVTNEGASATTGSVSNTPLAVTAGQPLRVMLAWSDQAAAAGANPTLVNDLDLRVVDPNGVVIGTADNRNVEEAVYIASPIAGTYTLRVTGANVPAGPQPYVLVATGGV